MIVSPPTHADWWKEWQPPIQLRFPRTHLAFTGLARSWSHTIFEVPMDSGAFYRIIWCEVQHEGFTNEYALCLVTQCDEEGLALSPPGSTSIDTGVSPEICTSPPPPPLVEEIVQANFHCGPGAFDSGACGVMGRVQDQDNYYLAHYSTSSQEMTIYKVVSGTPTSLTALSPVPNPDDDGEVFIQFFMTGDSLGMRVYHENADMTMSITDTTYPPIGDGGFFCTLFEVNAFNAYDDLVPWAEDNFWDTPGTDLLSHSMILGSGWTYGTSGSDYDVVASGIAATEVSFVYTTFVPVCWTSHP